jgi:ribosomal-protein-alanine N-acetyltransferase
VNPETQEFRIRPMTTGDLDRLVEIGAGLELAPHWPREVYEAALDPDSPRRIALVAESPGALVGFAVARLTPPEAELETIAVTAEFQRRGVAGRLFRALAEELWLALVSQILLEVRASNQPALEFYRSRDFVTTGNRPRYYADPVEDAVLMRLDLGSSRGAVREE